MKIRVAINGFGRIGRLVLRSALNDDRFDFVGINDLATIDTLAHLLKYDSTHGQFKADVSTENGRLIVNNDKISIYSEPDPAKLPWSDIQADIVVESSGRFRKREDAAKHLRAGAKKVLISAPATNPDWTVVMGVNHSEYDHEKHHIISNASCTTNCLAPVAKTLMDNFGIEQGTMTTIHAYTNDQKILDLAHKDLRRGRAAALSIIPTTTGAAKAVSLVLPELKDKLSGLSVRVPTPNVSIVDLVVMLKTDVTIDQVNNAFKKASETNLKGILGYSRKPLVSIDYNGDDRSGIVDGACTMADGKLVKILIWYDNEWGYSCRMRDLILFINRQEIR